MSAGLSADVNWVRAYQTIQNTRTARPTDRRRDAVRDEASHLGERKHEDEAREELDERDPLVFHGDEGAWQSRLGKGYGAARSSEARSQPARLAAAT